MKKIVITNAYMWFNKGDAGILLGIVDTLKKYYSNDVEFEVLSFTPEEDKKRYCDDPSIKNVYSNVLNPFPYKHSKIGKLVAIIKLAFSMIKQYIFVNINKNILVKKYDNYKALENADVIVVCGGGFLGGRKFDSLMHVFQIYINTKFNKKVIVMGTSIEPMNNVIIKNITEKVLKKVDHLFAREIITYDYCKTFLDSDKCTLIPDMAFMLRNEHKTINLVKNKKDFVYYGITVRNWNFPGKSNPEELMNNYVDSLAKFIEYKIKESNSRFVFIPQVIVKHGNDTDTAKKIKMRISEKYRDNFLIYEEDISPIEIKSLIGNMDYFIGTRMHSNIFATSMGVPTLAIAYEKKTNGIMHTVELDDYIIEMDSISYEKLVEYDKKLTNNSKEIRIHLNKKIKGIREEILDKITNVLKGI